MRVLETMMKSPGVPNGTFSEELMRRTRTKRPFSASTTLAVCGLRVLCVSRKRVTNPTELHLYTAAKARAMSNGLCHAKLKTHC